MQIFANNAFSTLAAAITAGATSMSVQPGQGTRFPTPANGDYFLVTLFQLIGGVEANHEVVKVTARSVDTFTIVRAQEGTTARAWSVGDQISHRGTAGTLGGLAQLGAPAQFQQPVYVPTPTAGANTTQAATTAFVTAAIQQLKADLVASSPAALDTLNEIAAALGNDANFSATMSAALGNRLRVDVSTQGLNAQQKINAVTNLGLAAVATSGAKADVGLGNVDNTSDANKPVSGAMQTALNTKAPLAAPNFTGQVSVGTTQASGSLALVTSGATWGVTPDTASGANGVLYNISFAQGGAGPHKFAIGGIEYMRIEPSGKVGIGTAAPLSELHIESAGSATIRLFDKTSNYWTMKATTDLAFSRGASEYMRVTSNGDVAVGDTNANGARLHLRSAVAYKLRLSNSGGAGNTIDFIDNNWQSQIEGNSGHIIFRVAGTTEAARIDVLGNLGVGTSVPSNYNTLKTLAVGGTQGGVLDFVASAVGVGGNRVAQLYGGNGGFLAFATGTNDSLAERMRIDSAGNVGIGTTAPAAKLDMVGSYAKFGNASYTGFIGSGNGLIDTGAASDFAVRSNTNLLFAIGATERARIDQSGNLLVGKSATNATYHTIAKDVSVGYAVLEVQRPGYAGLAVYSSDSGYGNSALSTVGMGMVTSTGRSLNAAGTVNASGNDYAEYYRKADTCGEIAKGQIVGIDEHGKLTDKWADSVSFLIKSTNPSYVGGDVWGTEDAIGMKRPVEPVLEHLAYAGSPNPGDAPAGPADDSYEALVVHLNAVHDYNELLAQYEADMTAYDAAVTAAKYAFKATTYPAYKAALAEFNARLETARQKVDRMAYCGQAPVNVKGAKPGQYIVPVQDGVGIAGRVVNKADMTLSQYMDAVGVVQNILADGRANARVKVI